MAERDQSYKLLFSHREMVADLVRGFVHEDWVAALDFDTLERVREIGVSHDLRRREDQSGEAELESWADRVLDAQTLDDVFNRPS